MDRIQIACSSLLASAFVLLGLVIYVAQDRLPAAHAGEVLTRDNMTIATVRTRASEEALFVIDSYTNRLVVYTTTLAGKGGRIDPVYSEDLTRLFQLSSPVPGGAGTGVRPR